MVRSVLIGNVGCRRLFTAAIVVFGILAGVTALFAGPPFRTDNPEPVDYQHWEFYTAIQYQNHRGGLPAGPHHMVFGVPCDDYSTEVKVSLDEDTHHTLEFQPVYAMGRRGYPTFFHGISRTLVSMDGVRIK